jgi:hypothetical protein
METSQICIITGLSLDIIGVIMIFLYGISPFLDPEGQVYLVTGGVDEKEKQEARCYKLRSKVGLMLVILGFIGQLVGR